MNSKIFAALAAKPPKKYTRSVYDENTGYKIADQEYIKDSETESGRTLYKKGDYIPVNKRDSDAISVSKLKRGGNYSGKSSNAPKGGMTAITGKRAKEGDQCFKNSDSKSCGPNK